MRRSVVVLAVSVVVVAVSLPAGASPGARAWVTRFNGGGLSLDEAKAVATNSTGGRIYVGGYSEGRGGLAVVAYDYAGDVVWRSPHYEPPTGYEVSDVENLVVSDDDRFVVLTADLLGRPSRATAMGFDAATGTIAWTWIRTPGRSQPIGLAAGPHRIFVIGAAGGKDTDWFVSALRPVTGSLVWDRIVDDPDGATSPDSVAYRGGRVFVSGAATVNGHEFMRTIAYAAGNGARVWADTFTGSTYGMIAGLSGDGSRLVVAGGWTVVLYRGDTGARIRVERFNGSWRGAIIDVATNGRATRLFYTGYSWSGASGALTAAYDLVAGTRMWKTAVGNGGGDSIAVAPSGTEVYVSAYTEAPEWAWQTVAFGAATGTIHWSDVYRGPLQQQGFPRDMTVAPEGRRVYVVGYVSSTTSDDFATVAYSTT